MAKKRRVTRNAPQSAEAPRTAPIETVAGVESTIENFAEDLGRLLGTAQAKAEGWLGQRTILTDHLTQIRDTAHRLLGELVGHPAPAAGERSASLVTAAPDAVVARGRKKKRTMSPEARERIAAAQRARWAKQKAGR